MQNFEPTGLIFLFKLTLFHSCKGLWSKQKGSLCEASEVFLTKLKIFFLSL